MTNQGPRVVYVPRSQAPHYRAAGYVDLSGAFPGAGMDATGVQQPMPAPAAPQQSTSAGCLRWLIIALCCLLLVILAAGSVIVWRARQPRAETAQLVMPQGEIKTPPQFVASPVPTPRPTPRPTNTPVPSAPIASAGPGVYQCRMCEAEHGCNGFRTDAPLSFGGGATQTLGWVSFAGSGSAVEITTSGPFGVEAVYRGCRKIGN